MTKSDDVNYGCVSSTSCVGLTSNALPEEKHTHSGYCSQIGVSTHNVLNRTTKTIPHWYVLRTTYGREKKAYEYITSKGGTAFYPTIFEEKIINGKRKTVEVSRLPNIFFAYGTEEEIQSFVYDNVNLSYLRFYYTQHRVGTRVEKMPLIVPDNQMESLRIICNAEAEDVIVLSNDVTKFKEGQLVRIIEGSFTGVEGRVARYCGQQRVGVVIDGVLTAVTAYIPSAFLEKKESV